MRFKKPCVPFVLLVVVIFLFIFSTLGCTQPNQEGASAVRSFLTVCKKANTANEFSALTDTITLDQKRVTDDPITPLISGISYLGVPVTPPSPATSLS